ncbi:MAG TPA: NfeD family protein [Chromatiaceae bacterium]|nr:NfeD family protein [Chromatiaceae bacterium]
MDSLSGLEDWHWALAAIVFLILEILAPGVFFMWMGIAAGVVAAVVWMVPELSWQAQVLMFAGFSVVSAVAGRKWLNRHPLESEEPTLNRRGEQYIGRSFNLDEPIVNNVGKIRVDDTTWKISGPDCPAGNRVTVTGVDGVVLQVKCG